METGMCSCDYDGESFDYFDVCIRKARKEHTCCECMAKILPGEKYEYLKGAFDGGWDTYKTCLPCSRIRKDFCSPMGNLREELIEFLGFDYLTNEFIGVGNE